MPSNCRPTTFLTFQHDAHLHVLESTVLAVYPFPSLDEANRRLFKDATDKHYAIVMNQTIFHPQGGGQPSDTGTLRRSNNNTFIVSAVRMDAMNNGQVLHVGLFGDDGDGEIFFHEGDTVEQAIDVDARLLYSRLHTAGHVLGSAVRHLLSEEVENFDELKASHFPDSASCEFRGSIDGVKWKEPIQKRLDDYVAADLPVRVHWWSDEDFRRKGLERLIPDRSILVGSKARVVEIAGCEVYPCGGTHVDTTGLCGPVVVKKIARKSGNSKVSYALK